MTLVIALMGVVGFGTKLAYGTNESSYKIGYNAAVDNYTNLYDAQKYCQGGHY